MRAGAGVVMPGSGASWPARSGQWRRAANVTSMGRLCPGDGQPLCQSIQFVSEHDDQPDSEFCREENFVTVDFQQKFRTSKLKPNVLATTLVKGSCSNSQPKLSNIITKIGLLGCQ